MKFYTYCTLLKINPEFADNFLNDVQPILFVVAVIAVILSFIKTIVKGNYSNLVVEIIICAVILVLISKPELLINLGEFIVEFIANLGGDLIEE